MPQTDKSLQRDDGTALSSPFVIAMKLAGIRVVSPLIWTLQGTPGAHIIDAASTHRQCRCSGGRLVRRSRRSVHQQPVLVLRRTVSPRTGLFGHSGQIPVVSEGRRG